MPALSLLLCLVSAGASAVQPGAAESIPSPLYFEANLGQADLSGEFIARGQDCTVLLSPVEATLLLVQRDASAKSGLTRTSRNRAVRMILENGNPAAAMTGIDPSAGKANYLIGNNPEQWRKGVPLFGKVRAIEVYPGIDAIYYAHPTGRLEYDFALQPGARPEQIAFRIEGADKVRIDSNGDLLLKIGSEEIRQHKPVVYQEVNGRRQTLACAYRLAADGTVRFQLGAYDRALPLTIDPVLSFSTYLGGSKADLGWGVAMDGSGNIFVAGETVSRELMGTNGVYQPAYGGGIKPFGDAFVAKYDAAGNLLFLTYLGGKTDDAALAIAVDGAGDPYVTGFTDSRNFPVVPFDAALRNAITGRSNNAFGLLPVDAFVTKLSADGTSILFSTLLGGGGRDSANAIVLHSSGIYVAGLTESTNFFPAPNGYQTAFGGKGDAFVVKLVDATAYTYCTFLGGTNLDYADGLAVDAAGNAYLTGYTTSTNFPVNNPLMMLQGTNWVTCDRLNRQSKFVNRSDAFVSELSADGTTLIYSSFLGGNSDDAGTDIAVDATGSAYVTGFTASRNFPTNTFSKTSPSGFVRHVFVTKVGPGGGSNVGYSTQFGGGRTDQANAIAVDAAGLAYVAGVTSSKDFFAADTFTDLRSARSKSKGLNDIFVAVLAADGSSFAGTNSVYLGGSGNDQANDIIVNAAGTVAYLAGQTASVNFPLTNAPQTTLGNAQKGKKYDAFVQQIQFP